MGARTVLKAGADEIRLAQGLRVDEQVFSLTYDGGEPQRLDRYLAGALSDYSRSRLQTLIHAGNVAVNGMVVKKPSYLLEPACQVRVNVPPLDSAIAQPENVQLDVVFENQDVVVVNKPAGMVVHPASGHSSGTLVNAVLGHAPGMLEVGGQERPGVVHRLDKDTSGVILLAKNDRALRWLQEEFRTRRVEKTYLALVDGAPPSVNGRVEAPIGRDPANRKQMAIVRAESGREAISLFRTIETFRAHSLLEVRPLTGRTHQIRLHCAFLKCPVVGDRVYGYRNPTVDIHRQFLHAARLRIRLPGESSPSQYEAPLPADLTLILNGLRAGSEGVQAANEAG